MLLLYVMFRFLIVLLGVRKKSIHSMFPEAEVFLKLFFKTENYYILNALSDYTVFKACTSK